MPELKPDKYINHCTRCGCVSATLHLWCCSACNWPIYETYVRWDGADGPVKLFEFNTELNAWWLGTRWGTTTQLELFLHKHHTAWQFQVMCIREGL